VPHAGRLAAKLPRQLLRSWYLMYFQLPWLPDRSASWLIPRLWRDWSPGYRADEDLRYVDAAIGAPERWRAALGYYRAAVRGSRPPARYAELQRHWLSAPRVPTLYLHGTDDGCADYTPWIERALPTKARSRSSRTPDTSCNSISLMQSRVTSSTSSDGRPSASSGPGDCGRPAAAAAAAADAG
jgi:hypothetical protein